MRTRFSSGSYRLDTKIAGGVVSGLTEIVGREDCGKSTIALAIAREAALEGHTTVIIPTSAPANPEYVVAYGDPNAIHISAQTGELALETAYSSIRLGAKVVILDALPGMIPTYLIKHGLADHTYGAQQRMLRNGLTALRFEAMSRAAAVVVVNEIRWGGQGAGHGPFSGSVMEDIADNRIFVQRVSYETEYGQAKKLDVRLRAELVAKRSVREEAIVTLTPRYGLDFGHDMLAALTDLEVLTRRGNWWYDGEHQGLGPGYAEAAKVIRNNRAYYKERWKNGALDCEGRGEREVGCGDRRDEGTALRGRCAVDISRDVGCNRRGA